MSGISFKAVALAVLATIGLDIFVGYTLVSLLGGAALDMNAPEQQLRETLQAITSTNTFLAWSAILGTLTTVVGGYVAARMAKVVPYMNAFMFGVFSIAFSAMMSDGQLPVWYRVLGFVVILPAALFGAYLAKLHRRQA